ncbi:unnamed protein product [Xylocopa violacea]|uniref:Uncharacterized protein n=1 Tax=Xylocopa violacea TaxID=135666 RepID=A0ABP1P902_XYLVO
MATTSAIRVASPWKPGGTSKRARCTALISRLEEFSRRWKQLVTEDDVDDGDHSSHQQSQPAYQAKKFINCNKKSSIGSFLITEIDRDQQRFPGCDAWRWKRPRMGSSRVAAWKENGGSIVDLHHLLK